jgi:DNA-directed RNA polymerase specialized sigma24 family protein
MLLPGDWPLTRDPPDARARFLLEPKQHAAGSGVCSCVKRQPRSDAPAIDVPALLPPHPGAQRRRAAVSDPYMATAVSLIRLAYVILGDRQSVEDVVQEAFYNLNARWHRLAEPEKAEHYASTSVLNGRRSVLRRRARSRLVRYELPAPSAEAAALVKPARAPQPRRTSGAQRAARPRAFHRISASPQVQKALGRYRGARCYLRRSGGLPTG